MFKINTDLSIEITRGDAVEFTVTAQESGKNYVFKTGDVVRFKVFEKKGCDCVVLQKDFGVESDTEEVTVVLEEADPKIGELIHKPKDYWYEVELNPDTLPYTIIGYDEDGAKVFKLYPEGRDLGSDPITPEDIPFVDKELDIASHNPVENRAITIKFNTVEESVNQNATNIQAHTAEINNIKNTNTLQANSINGNATAIQNHANNKENPHGVTAAQVGAVPTSRTVNGKSLTGNITLSASDVGARPNTWMPTAAEVGATPESHATNKDNPHGVTAAQVGARPNTWIPTAAQVGALPTTGGTMTGAIAMGGEKITGLGTPSADGDAATKKYVDDADVSVKQYAMTYAKKVGNPYNLFDNSDFRNPVNQRGVTSYVSGQYGIDRWVCDLSGFTATVQSDGIHMVGSEGGFWFKQHVPIDSRVKVGTTLTMVVKKKNKSPMVGVLTIPANGGDTSVSPEANNVFQFVTSSDGSYVAVVYFGNNANEEYILEWAALYEGEYTVDTLPAYQPKGYAVELVACNVSNEGNPSGGKVLWTNASPTSSFAAQTLTISGLTNSTCIVIVLNHTDGDNFFHIAHRNVSGTLGSTPSTARNNDGTGFYTAHRGIGISFDAGVITFGDGYQNGALNNLKAIPIAVISLY